MSKLTPPRCLSILLLLFFLLTAPRAWLASPLFSFCNTNWKIYEWPKLTQSFQSLQTYNSPHTARVQVTESSHRDVPWTTEVPSPSAWWAWYDNLQTRAGWGSNSVTHKLERCFTGGTRPKISWQFRQKLNVTVVGANKRAALPSDGSETEVLVRGGFLPGVWFPSNQLRLPMLSKGWAGAPQALLQVGSPSASPVWWHTRSAHHTPCISMSRILRYLKAHVKMQ